MEEEVNWGMPIFILVDEKNPELDPVTGLAMLQGGYGIEIPEGEGRGKYALLFQSLKLAREYIRTHPTAPQCIAKIECHSDAITAFQPLLDAGFEAAIFFVGNVQPRPCVLLSHVLERVRQLDADQERSDDWPSLSA